MKMRIVLLAAALILPGCGVELLTATTVQSELQAQQMSAMKRQVQNAAGQSGRINLEKAINTYRAEKGSLPPSLDALVPDYLPAVPAKPDGGAWGYDPATGRLLDQPRDTAGPAPADYRLIERIKTAIAQYGTATGYYPPALDALVPDYLPEPPRTAAGEPFLYNNQNGHVAHPRAHQRQAGNTAPPMNRAPAAGAGPMGEVIAGMGMQQELNNMRHGGSSAAGTRMRQQSRGAGRNRNSQIDETINNLGL
jgi:hypothetical protein